MTIMIVIICMTEIRFLQLRENRDLALGENLQTALRPHWDGRTSIAFGYGFDLLVRASSDP